MTDDPQLLWQYAKNGSETAFREFVDRRFDLVFSSALRQVSGDQHLAQEVAQAVFVAAARKASSLSRYTSVVGWLYAATRMSAFQAARNHRRWRRRSEEGAEMISMDDGQPTPDWEAIKPLLDAAMFELRTTDRDAILMRYFGGHAFSEVGHELGVSPDAARMRVERALERLRAVLATRGVTSSAGALAAVLASQSVGAAPAGMAMTAATVAIKATASGLLGTATFMSVTKTQMLIAGTLLAAGLTTGVIEEHRRNQSYAESRALAHVDTELVREQRENARLKKLEATLSIAVQQDAAAAAYLASRSAKVGSGGGPGGPQTSPKAYGGVAKAPLTGPIYESSQVDKMPSPIDRASPKYPDAFRATGQGGRVVVDLVVGADGNVSNAHVANSSNSEFEAPAVAAASQWLFQPGQKNGEPVNTHMQIPIMFSIAQMPKP